MGVLQRNGQLVLDLEGFPLDQPLSSLAARSAAALNKRCPRPANRSGALAGSAFAAKPVDQSEEGAVQPAFSAISRPWVKQLELMDTSS